MNCLSFKDSAAATWAKPFTLKGGLITFNALIICFDPYPQPILNEAKPNILENVRSVWARMDEISTLVRAGRYLGFSGKPIKHIVNIGIGGKSDKAAIVLG